MSDDTRVHGERSGADFIVRRGQVITVLWYEWDHSLLEEVRLDLQQLNKVDRLHDFDPDQIVDHGNGHYSVSVECVSREEYDRRVTARTAAKTRALCLLSLARELAVMAGGARVERLSVHSDVRDLAPPPMKGVSTVEMLADFRRKYTIAAAWLSALLGEPVGARDKLIDVAEKWESKGKPAAEPCRWDG